MPVTFFGLTVKNEEDGSSVKVGNIEIRVYEYTEGERGELVDSTYSFFSTDIRLVDDIGRFSITAPRQGIYEFSFLMSGIEIKTEVREILQAGFNLLIEFPYYLFDIVLVNDKLFHALSVSRHSPNGLILNEVRVRTIAEAAGFEVTWCDENQEVTFTKEGFDTRIIGVGKRYFRRISPSGDTMDVPFTHSEAETVNVGDRVYLYARQLAVVLDMEFESKEQYTNPEIKNSWILRFMDN